MLDQWVITAEPSPQHGQWASESRYLFASSDWGRITEALSARPMYAWNREIGVGAMVPVFSRFGIRVGFLGFPVLGQPWEDLPFSQMKDMASQLATALGLHVMRLNGSMLRASDSSMTAARPEVWIEDLQSWSPEANKRLRRDLAFARRSSQGIRLGRDCAGALACYRLYEATVKAHAGKIRYSPSYFSRLFALAETQVGLEIFTAVGGAGVVHGFAVLAVHGSTAYYLHGAADEVGRRYGVSDLLLEMLVLQAREMGASKLSLMSSPWEQIGLVKFKQKWGTDSGLAVTHDVATGLVGRGTGAIIKLSRLRDRKLAENFIRNS